jgi:FMN phosphatase YigB (HAD superfamily)
MRSVAPSDIRLVCFDLGGVVVRGCASSRVACARAGVRYRPEIESPEVRARMTQAEAAYELGRCSTAEYFACAETALDGRQSEAQLALVNDAWILGEYQGMDRLVGAIRAAGVETACLSNTNERHWELMTAQPLTYPTFAALGRRHASHLLGLAKPDPAIYRAFEEHSGVKGGMIVFFDDRAENVAAARSAGWQAECVDPHGDTAAQAATVLRRLGLSLQAQRSRRGRMPRPGSG